MSDIPHPASVARDFNYMPSRNIGRSLRRHSFSLLSGSRTSPFIYRPSIAIKSIASTSAREQYPTLSRNSPRPARSSSSQPTQPHSTPPRRNRPHRSHGSPSTSTATALQKSIEEERFEYRALRTMKMATVTKLAIADEESHLLSRIQEEKCIIEVLRDEVEVVRARKETAIDQLDAIRGGVETFGIKLPSDEELEAMIRRPSRNNSQSPRTSTRTPPTQVYQDLLDEIMERTLSAHPSSLSSIPPLPPRSLSHTPKPEASGSPLDNQSPLVDVPDLVSGDSDDTKTNNI